MSANPFTEDYYERGRELGISGYSAYRWLPELTIPMAYHLATQLPLRSDERILDFGAAKGYVVKALRLLGFEASGLDISEYAVNAADAETRPHLTIGSKVTGDWSWIIAKDVLEHLGHAQLIQTLRQFRAATRNLFVVVPLGDGQQFVIPDMEKDVTHIIREDMGWWCDAIRAAGFERLTHAYRMDGLKENWTKPYPAGNGFFIAS